MSYISYTKVRSDYPNEDSRDTGEKDSFGRTIYEITYKVEVDEESGIETVIEAV